MRRRRISTQILKNSEIIMPSKQEYNSEPVYYCKHCLSLKIMAFDDNDYCDICGSTDIDTTDIESWEKMYENKYNLKY